MSYSIVFRLMSLEGIGLVWSWSFWEKLEGRLKHDSEIIVSGFVIIVLSSVCSLSLPVAGNATASGSNWSLKGSAFFLLRPLPFFDLTCDFSSSARFASMTLGCVNGSMNSALKSKLPCLVNLSVTYGSKSISSGPLLAAPLSCFTRLSMSFYMVMFRPRNLSSLLTYYVAS